MDKKDSISSLGENALIRKLTASWKNKKPVEVGVGDDCAVIRNTKGKRWDLLKTDAVVEGGHFTDTTHPEWIGRKALARPLSDIAAMGGVPMTAMITLAIPSSYSVKKIVRIYKGFEKLARQYNVHLVGGETTKTRQLMISVSMTGYTQGYRPILRSGGKKGDLIWVTGRLGNTFPKKQFLFTPRLLEGQWLAKNNLATAMMDLSDGLGADLPRLCQQSKTAFKVDPHSIPRAKGATTTMAINDGEDFELIFTTRSKDQSKLLKSWPFPLKITCIGELISEDSRHEQQHGFTGFDPFA